MSFSQYKLLEEDALVMGHSSPDADSLCSSIAVSRYLISRGKRAFVFLPSHPSNLSFLVEENKDLIITSLKHSYCQSVKFIYVLDCEPSKARTGFPIDPERHFVYNIDHHIHRIREAVSGSEISENPVVVKGKNLILHLELSGSTCSILANTFNLKDDVLALGIIKDTLGLQYWGVESAKAISQLDVTNKRLQYLVTQSSTRGSEQEWDAFKGVRTYWDKGSDICVAYDPTYRVDAQQLLPILTGYCSVVVYYHKSGNISLKTYLDNLDLSVIAKRMGGGGHRGAAGFKCAEIRLTDIVNSLRKEMNLAALQHVDQYELSTFERHVKDYLNR